jgi:hypothetical protein
MFLKLLQKIWMEEIFPNLFYETSVAIPNPGKDEWKRKLEANFPDEHRSKKILNKMLENKIPKHIKRLYAMIK